MTGVSILPLALTVMLGPQILVAILLVTTKKPVQSSLVYILAVTLTIICTTTLAYFIISISNIHQASHSGNKGSILKYILVGLLAFAMIRTFINRKKLTAMPKWMSNITTSSLKRIFVIGVMLIAFVPTDIAMALTVGGFIVHSKGLLSDAIPFFSLVALIASIPLLMFLIMGKRGAQNMEKINIWLNSHGWVINMIIYPLFIYLLLA